jgi:hypothetical protein
MMRQGRLVQSLCVLSLVASVMLSAGVTDPRPGQGTGPTDPTPKPTNPRPNPPNPNPPSGPIPPPAPTPPAPGMPPS